MENNKLLHIVNTAIKHKMNGEVFQARAYIMPCEKLQIEVVSIFGQNINFRLSIFSQTDLYKYFEECFLDDIFSHIFNDRIWEYCQRHESLVNWMGEGARDYIKNDFNSVIEKTHLKWEDVFDVCMNEFGKNGYLSKSVYFHILSGYFEAITSHYFNIETKHVRYSSDCDDRKLLITLANDCVYRVDLDNKFVFGHTFFDELERETATENTLTAIKEVIRKELCRQKCT